MSDIKILKHGVPVRFGVASEAPTSPENGMIYYDESDGFFKVYENSQWQKLSSRDYADSRVAGFDVKESCRVATTANLSATYANGTNGVGATLTGAAALGIIDGVSLSVGNRILIFNQNTALQNGIYTVTQLSPFILTRALDFDSSVEVTGGEFVFIKEGSTYGNCSFVCNNTASATIGTSSISFAQISGMATDLQQHYSTGNQITTSAGRNVIIAGTEKLDVVSSAGMEISNTLSAGATLLTTASVNTLAVGSGKFAAGSDGDITKINNIATNFPTSASMPNRALANNGTGVLSFANLAVSNLNDVTITSSSNGDLLSYTSPAWNNSAPMSQATSGGPIVVASSVSISDPTTTGTYAPEVIASGPSRHAQTISNVEGYLTSILTRIKVSGSLTGDFWGQNIYAYIWEWPGVTASVNSGQYLANNSFVPSAANAIAISNGIKPSIQVQGSDAIALPNFTFSNAPLLDKAKSYLIMVSVSDLFANLSSPLGQRNLSSSYFKLGGNVYANGQAIKYHSSGNYYTYFSGGETDIAMVLQLSGTVIPTGVFATNSSGVLDASFFRDNFNVGNNIISGVAAPLVSSDLATKAYRDAVSLQALYTQDEDGGGATISTTSTEGSLFIDGTEKLLVSASGVDVSQILVASSSMASGSLVVGTGGMSVSAAGDLSKVRGIAYAFPTSQGGSNYVMVNNGSGDLSWVDFAVTSMNDATISSIANQQVIRYDGSKFINHSPGSGAEALLVSSVDGYLDSAVLQYNIDFTGIDLTGIAEPVGSSDLVNKSYFDREYVGDTIGTGSLTLQKLYAQDGSDALLTLNSVDGSLEILGTEALSIGSVKGFLLADASDASKASRSIYKHGMPLLASQTDAVLAGLTFDATVYQGCLIEYKIKQSDGKTRVGTIFVSTNGAQTSIADSFVETAPLGITWGSIIADNNVEIQYTSGASTSVMDAKIKYFT